ncbi:unnamed protein product [Dracunculus medinensis]|uniref:SVWC domain-containing protein n=1 Tax=Dracunculus medinensis TaxID=318479 RepID=A0A0N4UHA5_DRAME|nr:unnamed protein product [Dracunculus medinensis]
MRLVQILILTILCIILINDGISADKSQRTDAKAYEKPRGIQHPEKYKDIKYAGEGCEWFGTAPFCKELCPLDYDHIRSHSGLCSWKELITGKTNCVPDRSFGRPCLFYGMKHFCCKFVLKFPLRFV